jgi:hypothetical protein
MVKNLSPAAVDSLASSDKTAVNRTSAVDRTVALRHHAMRRVQHGE